MRRVQRQLYRQSVEPELARVILTLVGACTGIGFDVGQGALAGVLGGAGRDNVQGEQQKKLDVIANEAIKAALLDEPAVRALASEEEPSIVVGNTAGRYLVAFDPLDGSSNIDIASLVGTIFSIHGAPGPDPATEADFLLPGRRQVAAGYVLYGPSTMLVLTVGDGVQMYTLDRRTGGFELTVERVVIPSDTAEFAINMSNRSHWAAPMRDYIDDLLAGDGGPRGKRYNMRWVAAMVADVHRILCRGGLFTYPWDDREPNRPGKLRLLYEASPMAMLVEQAGGEAWTDREPLLDVVADRIHQRVPVILGSASEVRACVDYHRRARAQDTGRPAEPS